ncbi:hypothetical protein [Carp edema virus]|nr:hypothetical protein [Carp edema virus]
MSTQHIDSSDVSEDETPATTSVPEVSPKKKTPTPTKAPKSKSIVFDQEDDDEEEVVSTPPKKKKAPAKKAKKAVSESESSDEEDAAEDTSIPLSKASFDIADKRMKALLRELQELQERVKVEVGLQKALATLLQYNAKTPDVVQLANQIKKSYEATLKSIVSNFGLESTKKASTRSKK